MTNPNDIKIVDHLFRHQYGKMVAILSKIFGLNNLGLIEDAVQDTFVKATLAWRSAIPENPEAWLTKAAKHRAIDLLRQGTATKERHNKLRSEDFSNEIDTYFLDHEVKDSQLRMLFVACHPSFSQSEQIAFALKTISGFSMKEIAAALLQKEETIKKRLTRARSKIHDENIALDYPSPGEIQPRLAGVMQIIYLIFNEGFHSTKPKALVNKELCGEAMHLCKLLLQNERFRSGRLYALFALLCFHASRLDAKIGNDEIIDLAHQDRSTWYLPLIVLGNDALSKALKFDDHSTYHLEAAIASEHVKALKFENTNWPTILGYYEELYVAMESDTLLLTMATIHLQMDNAEQAFKTLNQINPTKLAQRLYLLHGCFAQYFEKINDIPKANESLSKAIALCPNELEKKYLLKKKGSLS